MTSTITSPSTSSQTITYSEAVDAARTWMGSLDDAEVVSAYLEHLRHAVDVKARIGMQVHLGQRPGTTSYWAGEYARIQEHRDAILNAFLGEFGKDPE